jgi:hypothetical protein
MACDSRIGAVPGLTSRFYFPNDPRRSGGLIPALN